MTVAHELLLSEKGIQAGVWIDNGAWGNGHHEGGAKKLTEESPVVMFRNDPYTEHEARIRGWLLD